MPSKDPLNWSYATWALALCIGMAGGVVNFISKRKQGHCRSFNLAELLGEMFTSGFVSLITFMFLVSLEWDISLCAAFSGVAGHMATRLLFTVERVIERKIENIGKHE